MGESSFQYTHLAAAGLAAYMLLMLAVGWWSRRRIKNSVDFIIAGRRLPLLLTAGTIFATWFCGGTFMGAAAQSYLFGNQGVIFDPWGSVLSLLLTALIFARLVRRGGYLTVVDFFDLRYGKKMGMLAALVQVVAEMGWIGGQLVAVGVVLQLFAGIPLHWGIAIACLVLIVYTWQGGMWSVAATDFLQAGFVIAGAAVLLFTLVPAAGGWSDLFQGGSKFGAPAMAFFPTREYGYLGYFGLAGWLYYLAAWLSTGFGDIPSQDLAQRLLAARSEKVASWGALIGALLYGAVGMVPVLLGTVMYKLNPQLTIAETEMILPYLAINYLPPAWTILFAVALIAAIMSSADSALLAASSVLGHNVLRYFKPGASPDLTLKATRLCIPLIALASLLLALYAQTIYMLAVIAWSFILVGLFAPYAAGYFWKKCNESGAVAALAGGLLSWLAAIYLLMKHVTMAANTGVVEEGAVYMDGAIWDAVYMGSIPAFAVSILLLVVVSLATQRRDPPRPLVDMSGKPFRPSFRRNEGSI
ncbi:MAG TPA: sodium:solute symporter family protein [Bacillota bacterium]|nr:sodium:solute symporter family protein [Bacillota bacterium]